MTRHTAIAAVLLFACSSASATAEVVSRWNEHPNAKVRLIAGSGRTLGIELSLAPGWKTYWRMPGDAGIPPAFDWAGSKNLKATDILYPAPQSMPDQGGIAVGYQSNVVFPVKLALEDDSKPTEINVEIAFGVCKDICIPIESKLKLNLPAGKAPWPDSKSLMAALAKVPKAPADPAKANPALTKATAVFSGAKPALIFETIGAAEVYIEAPDGLFVPLTRKTASGANGAATYEADLTKSPDAKDLVGKPLRITVVGPAGAIETTWVAK